MKRVRGTGKESIKSKNAAAGSEKEVAPAAVAADSLDLTETEKLALGLGIGDHTSSKNIAEDQSESSEDEGGNLNRIGNVPLEWYDNYDHIGYDVKGQKIIRKEQGDQIDQLLARRDDPNFSRTVYDALNDRHEVLTDEELSIINRIRKGQYPHRDFNPYMEGLDWFTSQIEKEHMGNAQRPKAAFIPSKHEAKAVVRLVHALRNGWLKPSWEKEKEQKEREAAETYMLWSDTDSTSTRSRGPPAIPPPKPPLPTHAESFNPPPEYLPTAEEKEKWEDMDPEDRPYNFEPKKYECMREVPAYSNFIKERFERCLDLYLCARTRRKKMNVDPESLIPKLPKPQELRPFPTTLAIEYKGHTGKIRTISPSPDGQWIATGSDDGTVRIWESDTGRCFKRFNLRLHGDVIDVVAWNPNPAIPLLAVAVGTKILLIQTQTGSEEQMANLEAIVNAPIQAAVLEAAEDATTSTAQAKAKTQSQVNRNVKWAKIANVDSALNTDPNPLPNDDELANPGEAKKEKSAAERKAERSAILANDTGVKWSRLVVDLGKRVKAVVWHAKGDYFSTYSTESSATSVLIHRLSKSQSQSPFTKSKGLVQAVLFHPTKPFFFVASQRNIRVYNLVAEQLVKKLDCPAKWISTMAIHPSGDHLLVGSYDRKLCWYDLDASNRPFRTLKFHNKAIRQVAFHNSYPIFASGSDDGSVHVFHGMVYNDLLTPPLIVPVKVLKDAHEVVSDLGVLATQFHPTQPWLWSAGADNMLRLFI